MTITLHTSQDADRLLGLADEFLDQWDETAFQSGKRDFDYKDRKAEWESIRPLFAASPSLLDALVRCVQLWDDLYVNMADEGEVEIWNNARSAIAKATGGGP